MIVRGRPLPLSRSLADALEILRGPLRHDAEPVGASVGAHRSESSAAEHRAARQTPAWAAPHSNRCAPTASPRLRSIRLAGHNRDSVVRAPERTTEYSASYSALPAPRGPSRSKIGGRSGGASVRMWSRPSGCRPNRAMLRGGRLGPVCPHGGTHRLCFVTVQVREGSRRRERPRRISRERASAKDQSTIQSRIPPAPEIVTTSCRPSPSRSPIA